MKKDAIQKILVSHLAQLIRERDPFLATAGHFWVQQYLKHQLGQWGQVTAQSFAVGRRHHVNWCLQLPAAEINRRLPILVGAHYDTVPGTPGADDNATGLAALLTLAQRFAQRPAPRPLIFMAFDLEEYGYQGSRAAVADLQQRQQGLHLMLSLEMLGYCDRTPHSQRYPAGLQRFYPDRGDFIALIGNWQTLPDLIRLHRGLQQHQTACEWLPMMAQGRPVPASRRSDHAPFWDAGYNAILVTDTADLRNPHYHQPSDTLETLDLEFLTGVCLGLETGLRMC